MSASLLLPSSVLSSTWFRVFSLFVAINTLIYLGLTLSKFVPWPRQVHPRKVRFLLGMEPGSNLDDAPLRLSTGQPGNPFVEARLSVAAASIGTALGLLGIMVITVTIVDLALFSHPGTLSGAINVGFGVMALISSITLGRSRERAIAAIWIWSVLATAFVLNQCWWAVHFHNPLDIADAIVVLVLIPPIALSWPASLISSSVAGSATIAATLVQYGDNGLSSVITVAAALFSGLILLHLRANAIDAATEAGLALRRHPTADPLTGLLSWEALSTLAPNVFSLAEQAGSPVHLARVEIEGLDELRADYGDTYADQLVAGVGRSLATVARPGELLARRGAASFALLGLGERSGGELRRSVEALVSKDQVTLGKRPLALAVESARSDDAAGNRRLLT
jgi:GGDEF domain-containing protein